MTLSSPYWREKELDTMLIEYGAVFKPEAGTVPSCCGDDS
jgi:hypothetical protein